MSTSVVLPRAVYRSSVANSRLYVGPQFKDAEATNGMLTFVGAGEKVAHPHVRGETMHSYGMLSVSDPDLIAYLDQLQLKHYVPFERVEDAVQADADGTCPGSGGVPAGAGVAAGVDCNDQTTCNTDDTAQTQP